MVKQVLIVCIAVSGLTISGLLVAQSAASMESYDEAADLARLATLENERMHYLLLRSRFQDFGRIWSGLNDEIDSLTSTRYRTLGPKILERSISELQGAVVAGEFSYEELTLFYLSRIRELESDPMRYLNAVISLNPDVVARARELDAMRKNDPDAERDPIFGIPVLLKDNVNVEGMPTTAGAVALQNNYAGNAFITERLLEKGAIILGKANLSEWAYFFCENCPSGYSAIGGQTLNPYGRLQFGTGGSSSGSGASIAANYAAAAVGSETSGSILSPSSANSLVGLKPTTGSLSRSGVVPISATLDTTGPMVKTVADAVILFNAMTGYDQRDTAMPLISDDLQLVYREPPLAGVRLGAPDAFLENDFFTAALGTLSADEAAIVELTLPELDFDGFDKLLGAEMVRDLAL